MSDLISRQAAIEEIKAVFEWHDTVTMERMVEHFNNLPSAQPDIIRCKECRYYEWMNNRVPAEQTWFCHNWNAETGKDDYCSYAERQEE